MGTSPSDLERIATPLLKNSNFVDINCGCPSPKVVGSHAGSGLLEKLEVFEEFLTGIQEKLGESRYSIKMRSGFHTNDEFPKLLNLVAKMKMSQLTLHARTRQERYTSFSKWNLIDMASQTCGFPVVGSGDIVDSQSLENTMGQAPLVEKIIVGRGALRNPWIFQEAVEALEELKKLPPDQQQISCQSLLQKYELPDTDALKEGQDYFQRKVKKLQPVPTAYVSEWVHIRADRNAQTLIDLHLGLLREAYPETRVEFAFRKFLAWYAAGYPGAKEFRKFVFNTDDFSAVLEKTFEFFESVKKLGSQAEEQRENDPLFASGHG